MYVNALAAPLLLNSWPGFDQTDIDSRYTIGRILKMIRSGDLDLIFKVTRVSNHENIVLYLLKQWPDFDQTGTDTSLEQF